jgi:quinol monooxygenase YgiN
MSDHDPVVRLDTRDSDALTRRTALTALGAGIALANIAAFAPSAAAQSQPQQLKGASTMNESAVNDIVRGGGLLVVAQWVAKEGQADTVAGILRRFQPLAQNDPGVKMFLIARGKENPAQFLFYELFADEAAFAAHQTTQHFKTLIAGEALPLLSKRERAQYSLLMLPGFEGPG